MIRSRRRGNGSSGEENEALLSSNSSESQNEQNKAAFQFARHCLYSSYVLGLLLITYLLNQLDRYMLAVVTKPLAQEIHYGEQACMTNLTAEIPIPQAICQQWANESVCRAAKLNESTDGCKWDYTGQGFDYQILAGPIFILVYTFAALPVGIAADIYNRKLLLGISLIFWSACTLLSGFVTTYWQLAVLRFGVGLGEAGCTPFATSLIADYFPENVRGLSLGIYNLGIYMGYSLSYALGNFITNANINNQGWRWAFIIAGIPGIVLGLVILLTVKEPQRQRKINERQVANISATDRIKKMAKILRPSIVLLFLASSIRNAAGYVWAYNTQVYFEGLGQTSGQIGTWMSWIPIVGGSIGVVFGGFISDRVVKKTGPHGRIWVLVLSQLLSAPFAAGVLFLEPPYCYISLIPNYIIGEMWVSVTLAVLVELLESEVKTTAVAVYFFVISNVGGNMPLLVPVVKKAFLDSGMGEVDALRNTLYLFYPGEYVLGAALFLVTLAVLRRDMLYVRQQEENITNSAPPSAESR